MIASRPQSTTGTVELGLEAQAGPPEEIAARLKCDVAKLTKVISDAHNSEAIRGRLALVRVGREVMPILSRGQLIARTGSQCEVAYR